MCMCMCALFRFALKRDSIEQVGFIKNEERERERESEWETETLREREREFYIHHHRLPSLFLCFFLEEQQAWKETNTYQRKKEKKRKEKKRKEKKEEKVTTITEGGGGGEEIIRSSVFWSLCRHAFRLSTLWRTIHAQGRAQASLWPRWSCAQEHRCLQAALSHHSIFSRS